MNGADLSEAVTVTANILDSLLTLITGPTNPASSQLFYQVGLLKANSALELGEVSSTNHQFWVDFSKCFDAAFAVNPTFAQVDVVRSAAAALSPLGLPAIAVRNLAVRLSLVMQARVLVSIMFTSRQEIDNYFDQIDASFSSAEEIAAGNLDNVSYVALIQLHAAVSNDLANRARPLPKMVSYTYSRSHSALWIAQNLYQDPSRFSELIGENSPIHPLFMSPTGNALSN